MRIYKNTLPVLTNLIEHVVSKSLPQINEVIHRSVDLRQAFLERLSRDGLIYIVTLSQTTGRSRYPVRSGSMSVVWSQAALPVPARP